MCKKFGKTRKNTINFLMSIIRNKGIMYQPLTENNENNSNIINDDNNSKIPQGKASLFGSIFNIANNVMGAGFLALPWAFKNTSIIPGTVMMIIIFLLSGYSFIILAKCCDKTNTFVYKNMGAVFILLFRLLLDQNLEFYYKCFVFVIHLVLVLHILLCLVILYHQFLKLCMLLNY